MIDFTKEELRLMIMLITELKLDSTQPPCVDELKDKIQSMIDNYSTEDCQPIVNKECQHLWVRGKCHDCGIEKVCEHESDGKNYCPNLYNKIIYGKELTEEDTTRLYKCKKCGEFYR